MIKPLFNRRYVSAAAKTALFALFIFAVAACTKEQQLEKRLYSGDGRWNLDEFQTNVWLDTLLLAQDTIYDLGTYIFLKDGSGSFTDTSGTYEMYWANSENEVAVIIDQEKIIWTVVVDEKEKQEWYSAFPRLLPDSTILDSVELFLFLSR